MDTQQSPTTVYEQHRLSSASHQPPHQGQAQHYRPHPHSHGSRAAPVFYHIHQAAGPPPPSRYYPESSGSNAAVSLSPPSLGEHSLGRPQLALLERPIKGKRKRANAHQLDVLNKVFSKTSFPSTELRNRLARDLGMTPRTVQIWFQNKRQASRQRDGHHSRNTKSMAVPDYYLDTYAQAHPRSTSPSHRRQPARRSDSLESLLSHSASPSPSPSQSPLMGASQPRVATSSQELMALVTAAAEAAPAQAQAQTETAPKPGANAASPTWSDDSGAAVGKKHQLPPGSDQFSPAGMMMAAAAAAAAVAAKAQQHPDDAAGSHSKRRRNSLRGAADSNRYAHTRNDQWFTDSTPTKLDYLYGHTSQVVVMSSQAHPPALGRAIHAPWGRNPPSGARVGLLLPSLREGSDSKGQASYQQYMHRQPLSPLDRLPMPAGEPLSVSSPSTVHRSMSLMDVLNAPPEQRKLPPLPPKQTSL
ncbi:hypothetical protein GGI20_002160 [Coemansia sp. BCRC 34301]|nr:hypothetical protein GGI20_002160 [Coemansia sp. BCRC 34301]